MASQVDSQVDAGAAKTERQRVVTLVHGTWAKDADWVKADSRICERLRQLGPDVVIRSFQWSGNNSHRARLQAAEALAEQLGGAFSEYPEAEHHLIGHSHGGNVALYALRDPTMCGRIASVVCLATPFIHAEARPLKPALLVLQSLIYSTALGVFAVLGFPALFVATIAMLCFPESQVAALMRSTGLPVPLALAGMVTLCLLLVWAGWRTARRLGRWIAFQLCPLIERYQRKLVNQYEHRAPRPVPVLNAQVQGDEPAWWLRALRWASEPRGDSRAAVLLAAALALAFGGSLAWSWIDEGRASESLLDVALSVALVAIGTFFVWVVLLAVGIVMCHVIFIMMPLLFRAHGGGFGEWSIFANWMVAIDAREEPAGGFRLESFKIAAAGKGLRHSRIYNDERVVERIGEWLQESARHRDV